MTGYTGKTRGPNVTDEHVEKLGARIDALTAEVAKLVARIDRTLKILTNDGAAMRQAHVDFEQTLRDTAYAAEGALRTTDKMVDALDSKVRRLEDEVIEERKVRIASSLPPPGPALEADDSKKEE